MSSQLLAVGRSTWMNPATRLPPQCHHKFPGLQKKSCTILCWGKARDKTWPKLFTNEFIDLVKGKAMTSIALCLIYINNNIINNNNSWKNWCEFDPCLYSQCCCCCSFSFEAFLNRPMQHPKPPAILLKPPSILLTVLSVHACVCLFTNLEPHSLMRNNIDITSCLDNLCYNNNQCFP